MSWQRPNIGSRMNREVHVRFWERAEVKFLRATRQPMSVQCPNCPKADGVRHLHWRQPRLAPWEVPRRDPAEPRPNALDVTAQRWAARQRWRERQRARNAAQPAAAANS